LVACFVSPSKLRNDFVIVVIVCSCRMLCLFAADATVSVPTLVGFSLKMLIDLK
jgi:hypothetical protein